MENPSALLQRWQSSLPAKVTVGGLFAKNPVAYKWKAPYRSLVLRESLFWRTFDALNQAQILHESKHTLGSRLLLRCALESVAVLARLNQVTRQLLDELIDFDTFDKKTRLLLLGSRDQNTNHESVSIMTIIRHMEKYYPGVLNVYNILSELAHPNFEGVCFGYSEVDYERDETVFACKLYEMWEDRHESLFMLISSVFEHEYNEIWKPQQELLEAWLKNHDHELNNSGVA